MVLMLKFLRVLVHLIILMQFQWLVLLLQVQQQLLVIKLLGIGHQLQVT